jgi:hypothetical protein
MPSAERLGRRCLGLDFQTSNPAKASRTPSAAAPSFHECQAAQPALLDWCLLPFIGVFISWGGATSDEESEVCPPLDSVGPAAYTQLWLAAHGCGLPIHIRKRHLLLMLKAFTDDSGSDPKSCSRGPVFVMAGYLANIETWNNASTHWQEVLDAPPKLCWFKSTGVQNRTKPPFELWNPEDVERKVEQLSKVIQQAQLTSFVLAMYWDDFAKAKQEFVHTTDLEPYGMLFGGVMAHVTRFIVENRLGESVQFEFDEQGMIGQRALSEFWDAREMLPKSRADLIVGPPGFGNDKKVLPLQMADMLAWGIRRYIAEHGVLPTIENGVVYLQNASPTLHRLLEKESIWKAYDYSALREIFSQWEHFLSARLSPEDIRRSLED